MSIQYKGTWNASINTPSLSNGTGTDGDLYLVSVAGTRSLGDETISFAVGDRVVYGSNKWTVNNSVALTGDILTALSSIEAGIAVNPVSKFAYNQKAYNDNDVNGKSVYNANDDNTIPVGTAEVMKVNDTVVNKGWRAQASSLTRMLMNHFIGRLSYNMNKIHDSFNLFVRAFKASLGQPYGIATLDDTGRIPASQLAVSTLEYKGAWNANTNTPHLADGTGTEGDLYVVSVAGTQNLGSGNISFLVNDRVIYNGSVWQRLQSGSVTSVNNITPNASTGNVSIKGHQIPFNDSISLPLSTVVDTVARNLTYEVYDETDYEAYYTSGTYILPPDKHHLYKLNTSVYGGMSWESDIVARGMATRVYVGEELNLRAKPADITNAINALDVSNIGGSGKYILAISETNGKISAVESDIASKMSFSDTNPISAKGATESIPFYSKSTTKGNESAWIRLMFGTTKNAGQTFNLNLADTYMGGACGGHALTLTLGDNNVQYGFHLIDVARDTQAIFDKIRLYVKNNYTDNIEVLVRYQVSAGSHSVTCNAFGVTGDQDLPAISMETVNINDYSSIGYVEYELGTDGVYVDGELHSNLCTMTDDLDFTVTTVADNLPVDGIRAYRAVHLDSSLGLRSDDGILINIPWGEGSGACSQLLIDDDSKIMLMRARRNGQSFQNWVNILTDDSQIKKLYKVNDKVYSELAIRSNFPENAISWCITRQFPASLGFAYNDGFTINIPWGDPTTSCVQIAIDDETAHMAVRSYASITSAWTDWEKLITNRTLMPDYARGVINPSAGHYATYVTTEDCYVVFSDEISSTGAGLKIDNVPVSSISMIDTSDFATFSGYVKKGSVLKADSDFTVHNLRVFGLTQ